MVFKKLIISFWAIIFSLHLFHTSVWAGPDSSGCTSTQCHETMQEGGSLHPADRQCGQCHETNNSTHPDSATINFSTTTAPCTGCHPEITDHDYLHPPVAAGDCLSCHIVHGQKRNNYINEQEKLFCYNCHNSVVAEGETVLHGEIADNKCTACHTVHGSSYPNLLRGNYSLSFFNDYSDKQYEFCFRCHKVDLLLHPKTSYNTKFRNAKKNLHFVHVNKKTKGRSCSSCHRTHASRLPHLMAGTVPFGDWQLPINFQPMDNGGKCSPGCHGPESYNRSLSAEADTQR